MTRILTCIVCPRGCALTVDLGDSGEVLAVNGNACKRGVVYAENECTHPMRTVTSTVRLANGKLVAVKTSGTVPKEKVFDVMREINRVTASADVEIGSVVISDVCGLGVDVVATSNAM